MNGGQSGKRGLLGNAHRARTRHQEHAQYVSMTELVDMALDADAVFAQLSPDQHTALRMVLITSTNDPFWDPDESKVDAAHPHCRRFIPWIRTFTNDDTMRTAIAQALIQINTRHLAEAGSIAHELNHAGRWDDLLEDVLTDLYMFRNICKNTTFRQGQAYNPRQPFDPFAPS